MSGQENKTHIRHPYQIKTHTETESKRIFKKLFHANGNEKEPGVSILISDNIDFKTNATTINKKGPGNFTSGYLLKEIQNTNLKRPTHHRAH